MSDKSLAIAYAVKRRAKMSKGGLVQQETVAQEAAEPVEEQQSELLDAPEADEPAQDQPGILERIMNRHKFASMGKK